MVVYGHTPVPEPEWVNNTMCLDTGCVFGGRLDRAALSRRRSSSPSRPSRVYYEPARPFPVDPTAGEPASAAPPRARACSTSAT